ncbi:UMP-CMP kinase 3-like isoform X2 [Phoenix dactylifera]|uniref:adenylate kinase n=1 Tax=Phoenix dactylifera TaxID=42345 RepID=A0A8B8J492_PHODC|nr:UMP-CMP kinase 3-like isoform X2 [Phoenix dactylifera]
MGTMVDASKDIDWSFPGDKKITVVFVLGGPGSGKGTQCANIVKHFGFTHLSAGDLLRAEIKSGSENGTMIANMIKEGKIVPSEVTVKLLQKAMLESGNDKFLIDGFPRNEENRTAFENVTKIEPEFVLFLDCPEEEMERRILNRNQIDAAKPVDEVFEAVKVIFAPFNPEENRLNITKRMGLENIIYCIKWLFRDVWSILTNILSKVLFWRTICRDP